MTLFGYYFLLYIIIIVVFYIICVLYALFVLLSMCRVFEGTHLEGRHGVGAGSQWTGLRVL